MLVAGAAGNYANVLVHGSGLISIGFSTAVFAVIGILSMLSYSGTRQVVRMQVLVPLMASAALLAMLGSAGERTDLGAHFFGLLAGLTAGKILCLPCIRKIRHSIILQIFLFCASLLLLAAAWLLACHNNAA